MPTCRKKKSMLMVQLMRARAQQAPSHHPHTCAVVVAVAWPVDPTGIAASAGTAAPKEGALVLGVSPNSSNPVPQSVGSGNATSWTGAKAGAGTGATAPAEVAAAIGDGGAGAAHRGHNGDGDDRGVDVHGDGDGDGG